MNYQKGLFEKLKEAGFTQKQIGAALGMEQATVSQFKNCKAPLPDKHAVNIAKLLGMRESEVLASIHAQWAKEPEVKSAWLKLVTGTAATIILIPATMIHDCAQCILC
ncbi:hypothetical protein IDAT_01020 [Pseudidiomarina atlantica]|uniref:HTH cro/C1-type domain-containing protein n=1 Tax=Pseudidiomarina atlantica TaxID=1517416 RepID=A0A094JAV9_9GAMM|nr:helix-turn-helix transcriptional regulator [Pseudidiomarina atlantica]KFZ29716.1 hypothetical protein IDAT_01020 [Pseudidiomarina atlantica]